MARQARSALPPWLGRALGVGPLIAAVVGGVLLWLPTHELDESVLTSLLLLLVIGGLRAADPVLAPVWRAMARVPTPVRAVVAVLFAAGFSITQLGSGASGREASRARGALIGAVAISYVLLRARGSEHG